MTISPAEALRLSKADVLLKKHGQSVMSIKQMEDSNVSPDGHVYLLRADSAADLIDEATAIKQIIIDNLRAEIRSMTTAPKGP